MKPTFIIEYSCYDEKGTEIQKGKIRVRNKDNEFIAKCSLGDYLKNKYALAHTIVMHSCKKENPLDIFEFFNIFK